MTGSARLFANGVIFDGHRYLGAGDVLISDGVVREIGLGPGGLGRAHHDSVEVIDMNGGLLSPGFVDAHVHPVLGGLERNRCDLTALGSREGYLRAISEFALERADAPWIQGGGWSMAAFDNGTPLAADLDAIVPTRPVFLPNRDHHGAWVNSAAMRLAGIDKNTRDPIDGRIERDGNGEPTGTLHEGAMRLVAAVLPPTSDSEAYSALLEGQRHLHSVGVTGWQDAIIGGYSGLFDPGPVYARAAREGDLTANVVGALWWDRERGIEQVADLIATRAEYTQGKFRATSVKIMQDGVAENYTASMLSPYLDRCGHVTLNSGQSFVPPGALRRAVARLDGEGFQVHVHAIGDRSIREALDAFTGTDASNRHHIAHLQFVHPDDIGRFAELGVAANMQMMWACLDDQMLDLTLPFVGKERAEWQYPFGDLQRAGARLVAGSDWPVSSANPLDAIHVAVNRTAFGVDGPAGTQPFMPDQALTLEAAFAAYTSGSAWANHCDLDGGAGTLRAGASADLVVLDRDPFAGPINEVAASSVSSTWVEGEPVYQA